MKFNINAYQYFYFKHPNFQEIWKSESLKMFTFEKKCHYFCTGVYTFWPYNAYVHHSEHFLNRCRLIAYWTQRNTLTFQSKHTNILPRKCTCKQWPFCSCFNMLSGNHYNVVLTTIFAAWLKLLIPMFSHLPGYIWLNSDRSIQTKIIDLRVCHCVCLGGVYAAWERVWCRK